MTTREKTIAELREIRASALAEMLGCGRHKVGTVWYEDRRRDVAYAERVLKRLGAEITPAPVMCN